MKGLFIKKVGQQQTFQHDLQPTANVWAKAYVYDFKADEIVLARKQEFAYNPILQNYFATDTLLSTTNMILGDFTKDKKVTKIEGPFGTENKTVTTIKLGEPYTFTATPNQPVAEFYLLAIKWAYRLDDGELTFFKNQTEITNGNQAQITVTFPKSFKASKIKIYGFYTAASERVCVELGTDYVGEIKTETKDLTQVTPFEKNDKTAVNTISIKEARVRTFLRMLRVGEGTVGLKGYTTLFGGKNFTKPPYNKDFSDHPKIAMPFGKTTSSAAGAYQVMGYTLDDKLMQKKRKLLNILDFSPENQDKFAIILLKYKRAATTKKPLSLLDLIIKNDIEKGLIWHGSYEWASLPPGRYGQPAKSMEQALKIYEKYLTEELQGQSDLLLQNDFLNDFGYDFNKTEEKSAIYHDTISKKVKSEIPKLKAKENIDLRGDNSKWISQFNKIFGDKKAQNVACWKACKLILLNFKVEGGDLVSNKALFQVATELKNKLVVDSKIARLSVEYIDKQLALKKPVLVGVDHTYKYKGGFNNDASTDHFVVIVGRDISEDGKLFYIFYEVGTSFKSKGTSDNNKLFIQDDFSLKGSTNYTNKHVYTVIQIRANQ